MPDFFPHNTISATYRRNENLREILLPSLFHRTTKQNECSIKECNKKCDICKNYLLLSPDFTRFATKWKYRIMVTLKCDSRNVIYLISCKCCGKRYVGSANGFKERFRIHCDINTGKIRCSLLNHLLNVCRSFTSKFEYLQVQLIENVPAQSFGGKRKVQAQFITQFITLSHRLNNPNGWYALNRRGYRK